MLSGAALRRWAIVCVELFNFPLYCLHRKSINSSTMHSLHKPGLPDYFLLEEKEKLKLKHFPRSEK